MAACLGYCIRRSVRPGFRRTGSLELDRDVGVGRLLVIDDGLESDAFHWFLQSKEVEARVVKDAATGLLRAVSDRPGTVVVSSSFGVEYIGRLAEALRQDPGTRDARLIALVDSDDPVDTVHADAVVVRPFHLEDLYAVIRGVSTAVPG